MELDEQSVHVPGSFDAPDRSEQVQQFYSAIRTLGEVDRAVLMLHLEIIGPALLFSALVLVGLYLSLTLASPKVRRELLA